MCVFWLRANFIALTAKNHTFSFRGVIHAVAEIHVPIHLYCPSPCFSTILSVIIAHSSPLNTFFAFTIVLSGNASSSLIFSLVVISLPCSIKYSHTFREADQVHTAFIALAQCCNPIFSYSYNLFIALRFLRKSKRPSITIFNGFDFSTFFEVLNRRFYLCVCSAVS